MKKSALSRRTVLRGMLGGAAISIGLPPLEAFFNATGKAYASGEEIPKRFGLFFWGNGVVPDNWVPGETGVGYTLSPILMPLAALQDSITVVSGTSVTTPNVVPHTSGASGILSGSPLIITASDTTYSTPTIDQIIANAIGGTTRFKSLEFGAAPGSGNSYNGPDNQNPPESSPQAFFNRIFVQGFTPPGTNVAPDPMLGVRKSILDAVLSDAASLRARLGSVDQARLDQHLDGIRELELQIANTKPPDLKACMMPGAPAAAYPDVNGIPQLFAINRVFSQIMAMALACDQTRVFSNWFTYSVSNILFTGATEGHHQLTHDELGEQPMVTEIMVQIMTSFADFLAQLKAIPEGDGTLLDHCAIVATTDCSFGRTHSLNEYPIIVAGTASGALQTGFHYRSTTQENASDVMLAVAQAMDVPIAEFGSGPGLSTTPMTAIQATGSGS